MAAQKYTVTGVVAAVHLPPVATGVGVKARGQEGPEAEMPALGAMGAPFGGALEMTTGDRGAATLGVETEIGGPQRAVEAVAETGCDAETTGPRLLYDEEAAEEGPQAGQVRNLKEPLGKGQQPRRPLRAWAHERSSCVASERRSFDGKRWRRRGGMT